MPSRRTRALAAPFVVTLAACAKSGTPPQSIAHDGDPVDTTSIASSAAPSATPTSPSTSTSSSIAPPSASNLAYDGHGACYRTDQTSPSGDKIFAPCPDSLLPAPPTDHLVVLDVDQCRTVPDRMRVRCPDGGPTAILPDPATIQNANGSFYLQQDSLECMQEPSMKCPPNVKCNPPPPTKVPCPPALLPKLGGGAKPTKIDGTKCWFDVVQVVCPKP